MGNAVTIRQIADASGLSLPTVSHVLNNRGQYSQNTRERVLRTARELGYRPNGVARAMRTGRAGAVALLSSVYDEVSNLPSGLIKGVHDELAQHDLHLSVARLTDEKLTNPMGVPRILREWSADGLLVNYTHRVPPQLDVLIERHRMPAMWVNHRRSNDSVFPDDEQAGRMATEHLLSRGKKRVAFVSFAQDAHYSAAARQDGYLAAMAEAGLSPQVLHTPAQVTRHLGGTPVQNADLLAMEILRRPDRPDAVVTYSGGEAQALGVGALRLGLRLPDDLQIVGISDYIVTLGGWPITTAWVDLNKLGRQAVRALLQKIKDPSEVLAGQAVPYRLTVADDT